MPRHSVGVVIGRNGEMIKKIQSDAGVKIQFKPGKLSKRFVQDKTESNLWLGHRRLSLSSRVMKLQDLSGMLAFPIGCCPLKNYTRKWLLHHQEGRFSIQTV